MMGNIPDFMIQDTLSLEIKLHTEDKLTAARIYVGDPVAPGVKPLVCTVEGSTPLYIVNVARFFAVSENLTASRKRDLTGNEYPNETISSFT